MIAIQHLEPGKRLRLKSGAIVEVVENPRDGQWLLVRPVTPDGKPGPGPDLLYGDEVAEEL